MEALSSALLLFILSSVATAQSSSTTLGTSSSEAWTTTTPSSTTAASSTSTSTTTTREPSTPGTTTEWRDMEEAESDKLVDFVVSEIQKMKMEHRELDECQELNLSSVLSGKKLSGKVTKYSVTLKVQPQMKNSEICLQKNGTLTNMHPEICEADVTEGDHGGTEGRTLLRSTCLQVEELQD